MTCPSCGATVTAAPFCSSCGAAVWACAACGAPNVASAAACAVCGEARAGATPPAAATAPPARPAESAPRRPGPAAGAVPPPPPPPPATRAAPAPAPARAATPSRKARGGALVGVAREIHTRNETVGFGDNASSVTVVGFRVDRFDDEGRPLPTVPVEMRGHKFRGSVNDGEWVEIAERWKPGELLEPERVKNLTTGSWVEAKKGHRGLWSFVALLVFVVIAGAMFAVFSHVADSHTNPPAFNDNPGPFGLRPYVLVMPR